MTTTSMLSCAGLALAVVGPVALGDAVTLNPSRDTTIYRSGTQNLSNGAGEFLFCGMTAEFPTGNQRRALLRFDLGSIPAGSTITSVKLTMWYTQGAPASGMRSCSLHRATADWGEGTSNATGAEGMGAPAANNDATWFYRFFSTQQWATQGGDFASAPSASTVIDQIMVGDHVWGSAAPMVADVQGWLDNPSSNFGWFLIGDESAPTTARKFYSRENLEENLRPRLLVEFTPPAAACYANCDNSTQPPVLNVQDFSCFLTRYAAGESYANCDNSTQPPVLNVQDFSCFLTKYAAGCSAP